MEPISKFDLIPILDCSNRTHIRICEIKYSRRNRSVKNEYIICRKFDILSNLPGIDFFYVCVFVCGYQWLFVNGITFKRLPPKLERFMWITRISKESERFSRTLVLLLYHLQNISRPVIWAVHITLIDFLIVNAQKRFFFFLWEIDIIQDIRSISHKRKQCLIPIQWQELIQYFVKHYLKFFL